MLKVYTNTKAYKAIGEGFINSKASKIPVFDENLINN